MKSEFIPIFFVGTLIGLLLGGWAERNDFEREAVVAGHAEYIAREIDFRAWEIDNKDWLTVGSIEGLFALAHGKPDKFIMEQFTGLKDKNGKEIYEGDVLQLEKTTAQFFRRVVIFDHGTFGYIDSSGTFQPLGIPVGNKRDEKMWEVIGNIHESPELLKEGASQ